MSPDPTSNWFLLIPPHYEKLSLNGKLMECDSKGLALPDSAGRLGCTGTWKSRRDDSLKTSSSAPSDAKSIHESHSEAGRMTLRQALNGLLIYSLESSFSRYTAALGGNLKTCPVIHH